MNLIIQHYFMKQHFLSYLIALLLFPLYEMQAAYQPEFSTAGFYELANSGREVYSMNPAWRFHKGVESSGKCKISKYFYKTRFWGLKTLVFYAVYH